MRRDGKSEPADDPMHAPAHDTAQAHDPLPAHDTTQAHGGFRETMPSDRALRLRAVLPETPGIRPAVRRRAAVMVLLTGEPDDWRVVFQVRAAGIAQSGEIGFPGGMADPAFDDGPVDTALRETSEELGIPRESMRVLGRLDSLLTRLGHRIDVVVGCTPLSLAEMSPNPAEVAHLFSLPVSWLLGQKPMRHGVVVKSHPSRIHPQTGEEEILFPARALALPERYHGPWGETVHPIVSYETPHGLIWGITGDILEDFLGKCVQAGFADGS